jgi:hypothetical protein
VSPAERSVHHGKLRIDRAISQAYIHLAADVRTCATFNQLLRCIRDRSPRLLDAPVIDGRHLGVEALVNAPDTRPPKRWNTGPAERPSVWLEVISGIRWNARATPRAVRAGQSDDRIHRNPKLTGAPRAVPPLERPPSVPWDD